MLCLADRVEIDLQSNEIGETMDVLSDILSVLEMRGVLYFRTEFGKDWGVRVPQHENAARFHIVHRGYCWINVDGMEPLRLEEGDLVIVPRGATHVLADGPDTQPTELDQVLEQSGFNGVGALVWGDQAVGMPTELICGHFTFAEGSTHPFLSDLPPCIHLKRYSHNVEVWLRQTLDVIGSEVTQAAPGAELIALKLSEAICAQAIRSHLIQANSAQAKMPVLSDETVSAALRALHEDPGRRWTIEDLARTIGRSRTALATRFRAVTGETVMGYLTGWRMQLARRDLAETSLPIIAIAERLGYSSESAFSRVFKRSTGVPPSDVRRSRSSTHT